MLKLLAPKEGSLIRALYKGVLFVPVVPVLFVGLIIYTVASDVGNIKYGTDYPSVGFMIFLIIFLVVFYVISVLLTRLVLESRLAIVRTSQYEKVLAEQEHK